MDTFWKSSEHNFPRTREPQLVRDWIKDALYARSDAYFENESNIKDIQPVQFDELRDQEEFDVQMQVNYDSGAGNWHTPSELFKPYYGEAIMKYINSKNTKGDIYELGPGSGALCKSILPHLKNSHYHLIEVSKTLHILQKSKFVTCNNVNCHLGYEDIWQVDGECTLIACEVLDNLPHDLIRIEPDGSLSQGMIVTNEAATLRDVPGRFYFEFRPLSDPLIIEYLSAMRITLHLSRWERLIQGMHNIFPEYIYPRNCVFIPTAAYNLFSLLGKLFPKANFMLFDFDQLPDQISLGGLSAPVVQTVYKGETISTSKLLVKPGLFDIFFPTNFDLLKAMIERFWPNHIVRVSKQTRFLKEYADIGRTSLKNGFNPLLHTFGNVLVLLAEPKPRP